jgi:hypothetical protein
MMRIADSRFGDAFSLDLRSLALFRIFLGLLVIMDLAGRISNFRAHYTDEGVLPRDLLLGRMSEWRWSLYLVNSSEQFQVALFVATWIAAVLLIVGYRTRLMLFIVWVLIVSLQVRNPMVLSGADTLLRLTLFWSMLLPLGAVWSIDSRFRSPGLRPASMRFVSFASAGLLAQIAIMYWFTAWLKDGPSWRGDGTALFYATGAGQITRPVGEYLHQFPELLRVMTHFGFGIEAIAPFFLFIPFRRGMLRLVAISAIISLHIGIMFIMDVALFPWISSLVMFAFLPESFWTFSEARYRQLSTWLAQRESRPRVWRGLPLFPTLTPAPSGGPARDMNMTSFTNVQRREQRLLTLLQRFTSAHNGEEPSTTPETPRPEHVRPGILRSSRLLNVFAAACIVFIIGWNATSVSAFRMPQDSVPVAYGLGLYQKWNMFAPNPPTATVWYVVRGYVEGGEAVDLVTPIVYDDIETAYAFTWEQPDNIVNGYYKDKYWRKYLSAIAQDNYENEQREFARYACRTWNAHYGGQARLDTLQIITVKRPTLLDGGEGKETRTLVAEYTCG